jgi:hypothetical protein
VSNIIFIAFKNTAARTRRLAKELNAEILSYVEDFPYLFSMICVTILILRKRPKAIFLQLTQGLPFAFLVLLKEILKFNLIVDMHTGFLVYNNIKGRLLNKPFVKFLRKVNLIIVHNETIKSIINQSLIKRVFVLKDPLLKNEIKELKIFPKFTIFTTLSFLGDEPLNSIKKLAEKLKDSALFLYTSKKKVKIPNMINLGYLRYEDYLKILKSADVVIAFTKREYTSLSLAFEAISFNKALICSKTNTLEELFKNKVILAKNVDDFLLAIEKLKDKHYREEYEKSIKDVREELLKEEKLKINYLKNMLAKL